jgi:hypothetical protein
VLARLVVEAFGEVIPAFLDRDHGLNTGFPKLSEHRFSEIGLVPEDVDKRKRLERCSDQRKNEVTVVGPFATTAGKLDAHHHHGLGTD